MTILNYMVTSNHVHLLVFDDGGREVIPHSIQLVAGRTGQEYNQRKDRRGAYWEDRYHATAVESGEHLLRCMVYIDTNMVRAGVVSHPSMWPFSGCNEIHKPRKKNILIDYAKLQMLTGASSYDQLRSRHQGWIEEYLGAGTRNRREEWTGSIAVGGRSFVEKVKALLGWRVKGRSVAENDAGYQLKEYTACYKPIFEVKKADIGLENTYPWGIKAK